MNNEGSGEFSSSPCFANEAIDNRLDRDNSTLIETLQSLLAAERAGARIGKDTLTEMAATNAKGDETSLVEHIQRDEVRYCQILMTQLRRLDVEPNQATGDFYGKCMAITDLAERLNFLNRGQRWVVRKIDEVIPDISDMQLLDVLTEMKATHVANIDSTDSTLGN